MLSSHRRGLLATRTLLWVVCLGVLAATAGCSGVDLKKQYYPRETVKVESGAAGPVPAGPVDEPALSVAALRVADACGLLDRETLKEFGKVADKPYTHEPDRCGMTVEDPGGKDIRASLKIGESMNNMRDRATGGIEGLPAEETRHDEKTCFVKVLTSDEPAMGMAVQVAYEGGDACATGRKAMSTIVKRLKEDPPKLTVAKGSLLDVDACETISEKVIRNHYGDDVRLLPFDLHGCLISGRGPSGGVQFRFGYPPTEEKNSRSVTLSGDVTAKSKFRGADQAQCEVEWVHRKIDDDNFEVVKVEYARYSGDEDATSACKKAVAVAKVVVGKLPKP
ncbi:MAG: hypothetical protein GEU86_00465 [Actinophytocola sp.]|nr:hypothetical protein [Actinophytocola sp.]